MKVHLIRSEEYDIEDFNNVLNLLNQFSGVVSFVPSEPIKLSESDIEIEYFTKNDFIKQDPDAMMSYSRKMSSDEVSKVSISFPHKSKVYTWKQLFKVCTDFRENNPEEVSENDKVVLLTEKRNVENWFGAVDESLKNYFVETSDWDFYFDSIDSRFPVVYCITGWLLRTEMFKSREEMKGALHFESIGCLMDFCENKEEISLKMRTADICDECLSYTQKNDSNRAYINQMIQIIDGIRKNMMFRSRSLFLKNKSRLEIRGLMHNIYLTDLGDLQVNLNPKERALYVLYLNHPEGILRSNLIEHKEEIKNYYAFFSNAWDNETIETAVSRLVDYTNNNMNEVLSRIRSKFKKAVGDDLYKDYSIEVKNNIHQISLDRELVSYLNTEMPKSNSGLYQ